MSGPSGVGGEMVPKASSIEPGDGLYSDFSCTPGCLFGDSVGSFGDFVGSFGDCVGSLGGVVGLLGFLTDLLRGLLGMEGEIV